MKFIADVMLGKLAKRMRLLGMDVQYDRTRSDNELIRVALEQNRFILTRDRALSERPLAARHLFIRSDLVQDQLSQVIAAFPAEPTRPFTRCSSCNGTLAQIAKSEARDLVPSHVYDTCDAFLICGNCGRTYWEGTHAQRIRSLLTAWTQKPGSCSDPGPAKKR